MRDMSHIVDFIKSEIEFSNSWVMSDIIEKLKPLSNPENVEENVSFARSWILDYCGWNEDGTKKESK